MQRKSRLNAAKARRGWTVRSRKQLFHADTSSAIAAAVPAAIPLEALLADGTVQGKNSFGKTGYGGPYPPPNGPHHYHFSL